MGSKRVGLVDLPLRDGERVVLTMDEAEALYQQLAKLFGRSYIVPGVIPGANRPYGPSDTTAGPVAL